jgi:hypothetical protein
VFFFERLEQDGRVDVMTIAFQSLLSQLNSMVTIV